MSFGPSLPPGWSRSTGSDGESESGPAVEGPQLPPEMQARPAGPERPAGPRRRVMGPSLPPPGAMGSRGGGDDSDDDVGPKPLDIPEEQRRELGRLAKLREVEERMAGKDTGDAAKGGDGSSKGNSAQGVQREDWMTVPPEARRLDLGLQTKPRQFSATTKPKTVDSSMWTESPEERAKRILAGDDKSRKRKAGRDADDDDGGAAERRVRAPTREERQTAELVARYNAVHRAKPLVDDHIVEYVESGRLAADDAAQRPFDRERDVVSRRVDGRARQRLLDDAQRLDDKFTRGKRTFL